MKKYLIGGLVGVLLGSSTVVLAAIGIAKTFPDVPTNAFYYDALQEMNLRGVVGGYANGNFGPNDAVTRGQLVQMLSKYNQSLVTDHITQDNLMGNLVDVVCAKITVDNTNKDTSLFDKYSALCTARSESEVRD